MTENTAQGVKQLDVIVKRIIDAPVELVWRAWTEPKHVMRWWGPQDYTSPTCQIDLREGGKYIFCMRAPQEQGGQDSYSAGIYQKIIPMERLAFTQSMSDEHGNPIDPALVGLPPDFPKEVHMEVLFKKIKDGSMTELTVIEHGWTMGQMYIYSLLGMHQSMDKLIESLK
jgi:uncharacterized protein YndB with AHSA1/START domain